MHSSSSSSTSSSSSYMLFAWGVPIQNVLFVTAMLRRRESRVWKRERKKIELSVENWISIPPRKQRSFGKDEGEDPSPSPSSQAPPAPPLLFQVKKKRREEEDSEEDSSLPHLLWKKTLTEATASECISDVVTWYGKVKFKFFDQIHQRRWKGGEILRSLSERAGVLVWYSFLMDTTFKKHIGKEQQKNDKDSEEEEHLLL